MLFGVGEGYVAGYMDTRRGELQELLDDGNVDGSGSARDVDLGVGHCGDIIMM